MKPQIRLVGDAALALEWPAGGQANALARALHARIKAFSAPGVLESLPALQSLLVRFDPLRTDPDILKPLLMEFLNGLSGEEAPSGRNWRIPVCYHPDLAPDIEALAASTKMAVAQLVALHTGKDYTALFLGFLPGFAYLGGLDEALAAPRLARPRTSVPAGSVALAGGLTAVYPLESPGGWHLIGRTPVRMFDTSRPKPILLAPGDTVRFFPISRSEFEAS